ncbi:hypothetical protein ISG33_15750 [Glaciecola sp. MH2013]|uniref:hypothetical protein n=1 Tax=Glaciecola sp. MH2013 TaxID=2785524 RepID=UPI00189F20E0|nr:hypothetical protein [Glaciecola sp. MH2013]MBF7074856.1 hypothetical protein [Glaciecola sp. MH2013]
MKIAMIFMLITVVSFDSKEKGCLENAWNLLPDSYAHKKFDIEHDLNKNGRYFSCDSFLTPFEISSFLKQIKYLIANGNKTATAEIFDYPLEVSFKNESMLVEDYELTISTEEELIDNFNEIFTGRFGALLSCANIQNVFSVPSQGVFLGHGELIFSLDFDSTERSIKITKISVNKNSIDKWLSKNSCESITVQ